MALHEQVEGVYSPARRRVIPLSGMAENLYFDELSQRWRYNIDGRLAETTESGPVRHRVPIDPSQIEAQRSEDLITALLGPLVEPEQEPAGDLSVGVASPDVLSRFRRRISLTSRRR